MLANGASRKAGARQNVLAWWLRVALPLVALPTLLLAACGGVQGNGAGLAKDQIFVWPFGGYAQDVAHQVLDPAEIATAGDYTVSQMIYSGLVTLDDRLHVVPDAAARIDVDSAAKVYTFHLRPGLRFSDGTPIRASDFAFAIDRALDPALCKGTDASGNPIPGGGSPYNAIGNCFALAPTYLGHIWGASARLTGKGGTDHSLVARGTNAAKGINVLDDQTLVIRLDAPISYFLEALTYPVSYPLEKSLMDKYPYGKWVTHLNEGGCSGPFEIQSYEGGKGLTFVPNLYWEQAYHKQLTVTEIDRPDILSQDDEYNQYRGGKYDYTDVPGHDYPFAHAQADFSEVAGLEIDYFTFNVLIPPFDQLEVRQALDLALNKQLLVDRIYDGGAIPTNHIVPQGMPGYYPGLVNPPGDGTQSLTGNQAAAVSVLNQARKTCTGQKTDPDYCPYIDSAHYPSLKPITIYTDGVSNTSRGQLARAAAQQWNAVLGMNFVEQDVASVGTTVDNTCLVSGATGYGIWSIGWIADYPDPQDWLSLQFATNGPDNCSKIGRPDFDTLFTQADQDQNQKERMGYYDASGHWVAGLYNQAEQKLVDYVGWLPYMQGKVTWRQRFWVHGFGLNEQGTIPDLDWPNVYILAH
jgi:peptide/nickel transport system substrate-binding protein/oligopeptide transport system substrate-binding protein